MSRDEQREIERSTILRGTVGSTVHGVHHGGQDDRDEMGIFVEPPEFLLGLRLAKSGRRWTRFEHWVDRTQPEGARSGPGDLDFVAYSLRRWLRLALAGAIVSRQAGPRYLGYLRAQKKRLLGTRGQRRVNRPELVEAHGFDTKYAMHVVRLGYQGIELLETGRLTLPIAEPARSRIMEIRRGEWSEEDAIREIEDVEARLVRAPEESPLREEPDYDRVNAFLVEGRGRSLRR